MRRHSEQAPTCNRCCTSSLRVHDRGGWDAYARIPVAGHAHRLRSPATSLRAKAYIDRLHPLRQFKSQCCADLAVDGAPRIQLVAESRSSPLRGVAARVDRRNVYRRRDTSCRRGRSLTADAVPPATESECLAAPGPDDSSRGS
jgi:hypothetical protein